MKTEKKDPDKFSVMDRLEKCDKFIAIGDGGVVLWKGFASVYELLGFIDVEIKPTEIKRAVCEGHSLKK